MKNIKSWNQFNRVNELRTETYKKIQSKTDLFPMSLTNKWDKTYAPNPKGEQRGRINKLASERFKEEFMKEFPVGTTTITWNGKTYAFFAVQKENISGDYHLMFEEPRERGFPEALYVYKHRKDGYYVRVGGKDYYSEDGDTGLDPASEKLVLDMLKYTEIY